MMRIMVMEFEKWGLDVIAIAEHGFMMHRGEDNFGNQALNLCPKFLYRWGRGVIGSPSRSGRGWGCQGQTCVSPQS